MKSERTSKRRDEAHERGAARLLRSGMVRLTLLLLLIYLGFEAQAFSGMEQSPADLYNRGNGLYEEGKYSEAIEVYSGLADSGFVNGYLFYNLGNACFKQGMIGRAILWYGRAKSILPRDRDVAANLEFARRVRADKIEDVPLPLLVRFARTVVFGLNLSELGLTASAAYVVTVVSLLFALVPRGRRIRIAAARSSILTGALLVLALLWLAGRSYQAGRTTGCVIMAEQVDAMSGPGPDYTKVMSLHEGSEAVIQEEREGWFLLRFPNGLGGWVPVGSVELF